MSLFRGASIAFALAAAFAAALWWLPLSVALGIGAALAVCATILFRTPALRSAGLIAASVLLALTGFEIAFGLIDPGGDNRGVVKVSTPPHWTSVDATVGYRPDPGTVINVSATFGGEPIFRTTYTIEPSGARATPGSSPDGPTYLFVGDSFIFGEGLADNETLPSQFIQGLGSPAHVVNLGVLGYGPNHLVRALETGLYDRYVVGKVTAVVTWIIPDQLTRVTGDGGWLTLSPRYVLDAAGRPEHTGSFLAHRLTNPLAGASYLARSRSAWVERTMAASLFRERTALYVALLARLKDLVRQRYDAPLVIIYHWPDVDKRFELDLMHLPAFNAIRDLGMPMVSVRAILGPTQNWPNFFIPRDGHPNARLDRELARSLRDVLAQSAIR